jgi:hypothetical protein
LLAGSAALIRQQNELPHGMFLPWIETEFEMGIRDFVVSYTDPPVSSPCWRQPVL